MSLIAVIFFIGNFWGRILGFRPSFTSVIKTNKPHVNRVYLLINVVMITATVIPFLFIQKGTAWNTIQFLYYALFHASIFTSLFLGKIFTKTFQQSLVILIIIVLNLPTTLGVLNQYLPDRAPARMPTEELHALQFLSAQPEGTVLTYPFISNEKRFYDVPLALRVYESTAYVSALSSQPVVMEDQVNLEITSLPWNQRRTEIINFFLNSDVISSQEFIKNYQVKYLYLYKDQPLPVQLGYLQHQKIYDTGLVTIYQFN